MSVNYICREEDQQYMEGKLGTIIDTVRWMYAGGSKKGRSKPRTEYDEFKSNKRRQKHLLASGVVQDISRYREYPHLFFSLP